MNGNEMPELELRIKLKNGIIKKIDKISNIALKKIMIN
jgi:hypothetical protein